VESETSKVVFLGLIIIIKPRLEILNSALHINNLYYFTIRNSERLFLACSSSVQASLQSTFGSLSPNPFPDILDAGIPFEITY
jgi:hypothetical protein